MDFRGSDLSGADFSEAWLSGSKFSPATLRNIVLHRAHCDDADFHGTDLEGVDLVKASIDRANFSGARMPGVNLRRLECMGALFSEADMRRAILGDAIFIQCDMSGADLRGSVVDMTSFTDVQVTNARVEGMTGTILGGSSVLVQDGDTLTTLSGDRLERWLSNCGAAVAVVS